MLMVTKDASWQQGLDPLLLPDGVAAVSLTSMLGTVEHHVALTDVSPIYQLELWETRSVVMGSEKGMRSVTVVVHKSAQILAAMLPRVS